MISTLMYQVLHRAAFVAALLLVLSSTTLAGQSLDEARQAVTDGDLTKAARLYDEAVKQSPKDREVLLEAGDVNMELERYLVARDYYERAVDVERKNAASLRKLGHALSALGLHPDAVASMRRALSLDESSLDSYLALTEAYIAAGRDSLPKAELTALSAKEKYPDAAEPYLALGDLYFARGVYELAMLQYEEAIKRNDKLVEPRVRLGRSYREQARRTSEAEERNRLYNMALQEFNRVTGINPKLARAWFEQGEIFLLAERFQEAGQSFESYTHLRPDDPRGDVMLVRAAFGGRFYAQAVEPLERIMGRTDSLSVAFQPEARAMLAKSYYAVKAYDKSVQYYKQLPDSLLDKENGKLFGSSLLLSGDTTGAIAVYNRMVLAHPDDCELSMSFGDLLYKMKRYDEVVEVFTRRLASCPSEPQSTPRLYIGLSHFAQKRYEAAIEALNGAIASDSAVFLPYYWLMNAHAAGKQYDKAAAIARVMDRQLFKPNGGGDSVPARQSNPEQMATAYFFIGLDAFTAKDFKSAISWMDKATALRQDYADAYMYAGFAYHSLSDKDNACRYYRKTLQYNPKSSDASKNLKLLGCE